MRQRVREGLQRYGVQGALIATAAVWGTTFVTVAGATARYPVFGFLFWRFLVASIAFVLLFPKVLGRLSWDNVKLGLFAGVFMTGGYIFQTLGLAPGIGTTPARAAFITGLYVLIVPLLQAIILRRRPSWATVVGALLALVGMWLLSGVGLGGAWSLGDTLVVICAVSYSLHMLSLGLTKPRHDVAALTLVQLVVICVVTGAISLGWERPAPPTGWYMWGALLLTGVLASAVAFAVQTYAQKHLPPARVALILVTEPAFGGLAGWLVAGFFPPLEVAGASLMLAGMVFSEWMAARRPAEEGVTFEPAVEGMPAPVIEPVERVASPQLEDAETPA